MANRPKGFGMTAELNEKKAAKYNIDFAKEAVTWMSQVTGDEIGVYDSDGLHEVLKSGEYLGRVANQLKPGAYKVNNKKMAFLMMENIGKFLDFCSDHCGLNKTDLFQTVDLYENQNMHQVVVTIHALGRALQKQPGYTGPTLGPKESTENKREFTDEQLNEGKKVIGLQMGTNKLASQAGMTSYGTGRQVYDSKLNQ